MERIQYLFFSIALILITACGGGGGGTPVDADPTADAGPNQTVLINDGVTLAGSGSDAEGAVTFGWTQDSGTSVSLSDTTIAGPTFTAPTITGSDTLVLRLTVTDSAGNTAIDTVEITVNEIDTPPTANAGPDQTVNEDDLVTLAGTGSDAEGAVTYSWAQTGGSINVTLSDATIANPTFTAPMVTSTEVLEFTLTVTDTASATATDIVLITVNDGSTPPPTTAETYLFYTNSLNAVDPATPASPILIEPTANLVNDVITSTASVIRTANLDSSARTITGDHAHAVIYPKTDGRFYRVSALKSGSLTPVIVSNETQADQMCTHRLASDRETTDFADVNNSQYLYIMPGADTVCGNADDVWKMIRLGMSAAEAPVIAKPAIASLHDDTTGAISGWLVHDVNAGELQRCDQNFANCSLVSAVTDEVDTKIDIYDQVLLEIDGELFMYDGATNTLSMSLLTLTTPTFLSSPVSTDGTNIYFGYATDLYQLPIDGSAVATVLQDEASDVQRVEPGVSNMIYQVGTSGSGVEIKSVPKTGGTPVSLVTVTGTDDLIMMFVNGNKVYYNIRNTIISSSSFEIIPTFAGSVNEDNTGKAEIADAAWIGFTFKTTYNIDTTVSTGNFLENVILAEGYDIAGTGGSYAGATITVYDAATAAVGAPMGTLATAENLPFFNCFGFGVDLLCTASIDINPAPTPPALAFQSDVYYMNVTTANSLTRVTSTQDENEIVLF